MQERWEPVNLWFEDQPVGWRFETAGATLTESLIVQFGLLWDPQSFHVDRQAAQSSPFGGLIASGFQTLALTFRLFVQLGFLAESNLGGTGLDELRWLLPVRPGDTLRVRGVVEKAVPSRSKPDRGLVAWRMETLNQNGEIVLSFLISALLRRRLAPAAD